MIFNQNGLCSAFRTKRFKTSSNAGFQCSQINNKYHKDENASLKLTIKLQIKVKKCHFTCSVVGVGYDKIKTVWACIVRVFSCL